MKRLSVNMGGFVSYYEEFEQPKRKSVKLPTKFESLWWWWKQEFVNARDKVWQKKLLKQAGQAETEKEHRKYVKAISKGERK